LVKGQEILKQLGSAGKVLKKTKNSFFGWVDRPRHQDGGFFLFFDFRTVK